MIQNISSQRTPHNDAAVAEQMNGACLERREPGGPSDPATAPVVDRPCTPGEAFPEGGLQPLAALSIRVSEGTEYLRVEQSRVIHRTPVWSWPRSRRSGCVPAEPYPSLRSLVVYSESSFVCKIERKNALTIAALSDMFLTLVKIAPSAICERYSSLTCGADKHRAASIISSFLSE